ncbi:MAG: hypothetical protein AAGF71_07415 [Pseudomonadota bacterium]
MLLDRTIFQLDIGQVDPDQAEELGHLGYMQWLGALRGDQSYPEAAMRAYNRARRFRKNSPAVGVFCDLLVASVSAPIAPLTLKLPAKTRRGGAQARRLSL